CQTYISSPLTF
nr:immunoglobulin light chain junction region [Macaca mulatta]MOW73922.1 immunoglobulin light chain junction region [Macaca mulatta]